MFPNSDSYHPLFDSLVMNPVYHDRSGSRLEQLAGQHLSNNFTSAVVNSVGKDNRKHEHGCCGMSMYFHACINEPYVLFKSWQIDTIGGLVGSMVAIFFMAMLYEGIKTFRQFLVHRSSQSSKTASFCAAPKLSSVCSSDMSKEQTLPELSYHYAIKSLFRSNPFTWIHIIQTSLHMIQLVVSYFLMLIAMTYNVWLCLALVLGAGVGYFVFGLIQSPTAEINNEHCH